MAQKDWVEIIKKFNNQEKNFIANFLASKDSFCPNENNINIFDNNNLYSDFSSSSLQKSKPSNWIPIYKKEDLSSFMIDNNITPIRSGSGQFFFYKGNVFYDVTKIKFNNIDIDKIKPIDNFIPLSLEVDFQKNENAFLNKAMAIGIINNFLNRIDLKVLNKTIYTQNSSRLLHGQFGKIKTTFDLMFKTTKNCKLIKRGFQFEIDLVLESKDEIYIFEAKSKDKYTTTFSLLQLYYPLIYLQMITTYRKKIRTIFIDITAENNKEIYRLVEFHFKNDNIDDYQIVKSYKYEIEDKEQYILENIIKQTS